MTAALYLFVAALGVMGICAGLLAALWIIAFIVRSVRLLCRDISRALRTHWEERAERHLYDLVRHGKAGL